MKEQISFIWRDGSQKRKSLRNEQNEMAAYLMGGHICKLSNKGLISKLYKKLAELNIKRIWLKNGQRAWIDIFPKKTYKW